MQQPDIQNFLSHAAHDLKSPLRRIASYCAMLREDAGPRLENAEHGMLTRIETNTARLQDLIENLVTYTRLQTLDSTPGPIDLNSFIHDTHLAVPPLADEKRTIDIPPLPPVQAHSKDLALFLINILKNAQAYRNTSRPLHTAIRATLTGDTITLSITDNGLGIAPEYHTDVLLPFKRLHTQDDIEGSGLGLAICQLIADRHNAEFTLESTQGEGSTFTLKLPCP